MTDLCNIFLFLQILFPPDNLLTIAIFSRISGINPMIILIEWQSMQKTGIGTDTEMLAHVSKISFMYLCIHVCLTCSPWAACGPGQLVKQPHEMIKNNPLRFMFHVISVELKLVWKCMQGF